MKRFFSVFLAAVLLMVLAVPASAAESYIWDEAGLLTEEGRAELNETAREISERTGCGVYFLSIPDYTVYGKGTIGETADWLYSEKGLGVGNNQDGVLLVLSMADRDYSLIPHGFGGTAITVTGLDYITKACLDDFGDNAWYHGVYNYLNATDTLLTRARNGDIYDRDKVSSGSQWTWSLIIGLSLALIVCVTQQAVMKKKVREQTQALGYLKKGSVNITRRSDRYTHTTETRVKINNDNDKDNSSGGDSTYFRTSDGSIGKSGKF